MPIGTVYKAPIARAAKQPPVSNVSPSAAARSVSSLSGDAAGSSSTLAAPYDQRSHQDDLSVDSESEGEARHNDEPSEPLADTSHRSTRSGSRDHISRSSENAPRPYEPPPRPDDYGKQQQARNRLGDSSSRKQESSRYEKSARHFDSQARHDESSSRSPEKSRTRDSIPRLSTSGYSGDAGSSAFEYSSSDVRGPTNITHSRDHPRGQAASSAPLSLPVPATPSGAQLPPRSSSSRTSDPSSSAPFFGKPSTQRPCKIMILYYSTYGHIKLMADAVAAGINSIEGASAVMYQVPETLSDERLRKMNAPPRPNDPVLEYDEMNVILQDISGIMFGIPTRFGMMPAQMKAWFDSTSKLWTKGHLVGKPAGCFFSTAVQGGGQETTALTTVTQLTHHGMLFVPPGYSFGGRMFDNTEVHGGSPYGAGCIAGGDGSRLPSKFELDFARHQGAQFAIISVKLAC